MIATLFPAIGFLVLITYANILKTLQVSRECHWRDNRLAAAGLPREMASSVRYQCLNSAVNTPSNLNEDRGRTMPQRPRNEIRNDQSASLGSSRKGGGRIDETERYLLYVRVGIKNRPSVYLLWLELNVATLSTMMVGMKRLCEEQKNFKPPL